MYAVQGRNRFRGPSYFNVDFAVLKNTKIPGWEGALLGIGFQFFSLFNHPNFGFPDNFVSSPTRGQNFLPGTASYHRLGTCSRRGCGSKDDPVEGSAPILVLRVRMRSPRESISVFRSSPSSKSSSYDSTHRAQNGVHRETAIQNIARRYTCAKA